MNTQTQFALDICASAEIIKSAAATKMSQSFRLLTSRETAEYYTPPEYIALARLVMKDIDLDPASNPTPQQWIQARRFYTKSDNGLGQPWQGRVWLNPPYNGNSAKWSSKLVREYQEGRVSEALLLVNSKLGYNWFEELWDAADSTCFVRQRIAFISSDDKPKTDGDGKAKQASTIFYFGPNVTRFYKVFSPIGRVYPQHLATPFGATMETQQPPITYPLTIAWPPGTPTALVGDNWVLDMNTGEIRATYQNRTELERAVYNLAMVKEAVALGGRVRDE